MRAWGQRTSCFALLCLSSFHTFIDLQGHIFSLLLPVYSSGQAASWPLLCTCVWFEHSRLVHRKPRGSQELGGCLRITCSGWVFSEYRPHYKIVVLFFFIKADRHYCVVFPLKTHWWKSILRKNIFKYPLNQTQAHFRYICSFRGWSRFFFICCRLLLDNKNKKIWYGWLYARSWNYSGGLVRCLPNTFIEALKTDILAWICTSPAN